jgi:DNA repair protein RadC
MRVAVTTLAPYDGAPGFEVWEHGSSADRPPRIGALAREAGLDRLAREEMWAWGLDPKHRVVARWLVGAGSLSSAPVHPREVFGPALRLGVVASIAVTHNHPSGDAAPSPEDIAVTRRLIEAGRLLGVPLIDHVVVTPSGAHTSIRGGDHALSWS